MQAVSSAMSSSGAQLLKSFHHRLGPALVLTIASLLAVALFAGAPGSLPRLIEGPKPMVPPARSTAGAPTAGEKMLWRPVAVGGGGFITGLSWDRTGTSRVARADVYGAYRWDAAADRWVQLITRESMPPAFHQQNGIATGVYEIAVAPSDAKRTYMAAANRLWRSDDGGRRWALLDLPAGAKLEFDANSPHRLSGPYIAISPADPDLVLFGLPQGLFISTDGGVTWQTSPRLPRPPVMGRDAPGMPIWFDPAAPNRALVASPGHGMFVVEMGSGAPPKATPMPRGPQFARAGAFAPDGSFYAADGAAQRVWKFAAGKWTDLVGTTGLPARAFVSVAADPRGGAVIAGDEGGRLWCSSDGGARWTSLSRRSRAGEGDPPWLRVSDLSYFAGGRFAFDPVEPGRLWVAAGVGVFKADMAEPCGPVRWESQTRGIEELVANDAVQRPGFAPVFAAWDFGIHVKPDLDRWSTTYGPQERVLIAAQQVDWTASTPGFLVTNASDTRKCCAEDGRSVLAGYSTDGGLTWARFRTLPTPPGTDASDPWRMAFGTIAVAADSPDNIVWVPGFNRSPFYTRDRGRSWERVVFPGEVLPNTGSFDGYYPQRKTLAADRVLPGTFYLFHDGEGMNARLTGLWRTRDGGRSWALAFRGRIVPATARAARLRAVPGHAGHLFYTSGMAGADSRLRRSQNGGRSWEAEPRVTQVDDIAFGKAAPGAAYPTIFVSAKVDGVYGIWRSTDRLRSWQRLVDFPLGTLDQVTVIEGDKDVFGRVYIGYQGSGWIYGEPAACDTRAASQLPDRRCAAVSAAK
jgi:photosystem II stability/assembly factor-like uncharacterized protein